MTRVNAAPFLAPVRSIPGGRVTRVKEEPGWAAGSKVSSPRYGASRTAHCWPTLSAPLGSACLVSGLDLSAGPENRISSCPFQPHKASAEAEASVQGKVHSRLQAPGGVDDSACVPSTWRHQ